MHPRKIFQKALCANRDDDRRSIVRRMHPKTNRLDSRMTDAENCKSSIVMKRVRMSRGCALRFFRCWHRQAPTYLANEICRKCYLHPEEGVRVRVRLPLRTWHCRPLVCRLSSSVRWLPRHMWRHARSTVNTTGSDVTISNHVWLSFPRFQSSWSVSAAHAH